MQPQGTPVFKLVRPDDPDTSHEAAEQVNTSRLETEVASVINRFGADGCISDEVRAALPGLSYSSVTARFKALKEKGWIVTDQRTRPGNTGRNQHVMWGANYYVPVQP